MCETEETFKELMEWLNQVTQKKPWTKEELLGEIMQAENEDKAVQMLTQGLPDNFGINEKISNRSVLNFACFKGRVETVKLLIKLGADVESGNRYNETCLIAAVQGDNIEVVTVLLEAGANVGHRDDNGMKAIQYATQNQSHEMIGLLQTSFMMGMF